MKGGTRTLLAAGAGIVVVLGAVALGVALTSGGDDEGDRIALAAPVDGVVAIPGLAPRFAPAVTTVDGSLFVFGGLKPGRPEPRGPGFAFPRDGVLVSADFSSAELITDAPFDPPLYAPRALGMDERILVTGVACEVQGPVDDDASEPNCEPGTLVAAVLDLRDGARKWRRVDLPQPIREQTLRRAGGGFVDLIGVTADGRAVVRFGLRGNDGYWTFDPDADAWDPIEAAPTGSSATCLAGNRLVVLTSSPAGVVLASRDVVAGGPWTNSPPLAWRSFDGQPPDIACLDDAVAVRDAAFVETLRLYSFTNGRWSAPPPVPSRDFFLEDVWTGTELVFLPGTDEGTPAMAYDSRANSWRTFVGARGPVRGTVWNGTRLVGYAEPMIRGEAGGRHPHGVYTITP